MGDLNNYKSETSICISPIYMSFEKSELVCVLQEISISMCPTEDKYKYMYKLSITYEEIYISVCRTGDKYKYVSYGR